MEMPGEALAAGRHLGDLGRYDEARTNLQKLLEMSKCTDRLPVVAELADITARQGRWKAALQILDSELARASPEARATTVGLRLQMEACLLRSAVDASFSGVMEQADEVFQRFVAMPGVDKLDTHWVQTETSFLKLRSLVSRCHQPSVGEGLESALEWLYETFEELMEAERFREALCLATDCSRILQPAPGPQKLQSPDWKHCYDMLDAIIESPASPSLLKAKAIGHLVDEFEEDMDSDRLEALQARAVRLFEDENHAHGAMDMRFRQARQGIKRDYQYLTDELLDELKKYFEVYDTMEAIAPYQRAIQALLIHMPPWLAFELQMSLSNMMDDLSNVAGKKLETLMAQIRRIAAWLARSGGAARAIEAAESLDATISEEDVRYAKGMIANIAAQAHAQLEDYCKAQVWAEKAVDIYGIAFPAGRAEAARIVLLTRVKASPEQDRIDESIVLAESEIEKDIRGGLLQPAIQKLELIVSQVFTPRRDPRRDEWLDKMEQLARTLQETSTEEGDLQTASVCQMRGLALLSDGGAAMGEAHWEQSIKYLDEAVALYMRHHRLIEAASTRQMEALVFYAKFQRQPEVATINRCIELISVARDAFRVLDNMKFVTTSTRWHAFYLYQAWIRGWMAGDSVLVALREAEEAWAEERAEMAVFSGLEAVSRKQTLSSAKELRELYTMATHVCTREWKASKMWEWVQHAKARSLSDQLGVDVLIPGPLRDQVMADPTMKTLLTQEEQLCANIASSERGLRMRLRGELHVLRQAMAAQPLLKAVMDHRSGMPVSIGQIRDLAKQIAGRRSVNNVLFVDWVDLGHTLAMVTLKGDAEPQLWGCGLTVKDVVAWKEEWLDAEPGQTSKFEEDDFFEEDDPEFCLRMLDNLVSPLANLVTKDDLVVLCPTSVLHSIPLHALYVSPGTPVIALNPVVYSASLTVFWQCCRRAESPPVDDIGWNMMGVYEPGLGRRFHSTEQALVHDSTLGLAQKHGAAALTGQAATKGAFAALLQRSAAFHFHGHYLFDHEALADQSVELADGTFSVRAVFDLKLKAPHITLIACDSASQGIRAGDEPLGLVTALLCAGAGSVAGTLWPTTSRTGRHFSDEFYTSLKGQPDGDIYDLAEALRRTVLTLRECNTPQLRQYRETRRPYHWAAFVLHGSWCMRQSRALPLNEVGR